MTAPSLREAVRDLLAVVDELDREGAPAGYYITKPRFDRLRSALSSDGWVSVEARMPEDDVDVLCWRVCSVTGDGSAHVGAHDGHFYSTNGGTLIANVTHWMELPDPPKGSEVKHGR